MSKAVRMTFDEAKKNKVGAKRLAAMAVASSREADLSEIPELTEKFWQSAVPNPYYKPLKKQITVRIDTDILAWLRKEGAEGYQSRMNALLRDAMLQNLTGKRRRA